MAKQSYKSLIMGIRDFFIYNMAYRPSFLCTFDVVILVTSKKEQFTQKGIASF